MHVPMSGPAGIELPRTEYLVGVTRQLLGFNSDPQLGDLLNVQFPKP